MEETNYFLIGLSFFILGVIMVHYARKRILKFRRLKYDPFKDKEKGIFRLMNAEVYYKSYGAFILGVLSILLSLIFMIFGGK